MQKIFRAIFLILILFLSVRSFSQTVATAESPYQYRFTTLEQPSYITIGEGFGNIEPLVYEVSFAPTFYLGVKQLPDWGFVFIPQILLRMYDQYSHPVRTPSYMPRGTLFYHFANAQTNKNDRFVFLTVGHHSNGQDGSFFQADSTTINTHDGSFASNYVAAGYEFVSENKRSFTPVNALRLTSAYYFIVNPTIRNMYGRLRLLADMESTLILPNEMKNIFSGTASRSKLSGTMQLGWIGLEMIDAKPFDFKRLIFNYTLSYQPAFINDVSLFTRFYYGQDYYNINLGRTLTTLQFGFSFRNFSFR